MAIVLKINKMSEISRMFGKEISEEISRIFGKDMTDEERRDALIPLLDRAYLEIKNSSSLEDRLVCEYFFGGLVGKVFDCLFERLKKPLIQNLIEIYKYPELESYALMLLKPWRPLSGDS